MKKNSLLENGESIIRILDFTEDKVFVIDCIKRNMPKWVNKADMVKYTECAEQSLWETTNKSMVDIELMDANIRRFVHKHFTFIAGVLPYVGDTKRRSEAIEQAAKEMGISKQSIRYYLCLYLAYQDISALIPKSKSEDRDLTADEKNMRWGLNKFFYTKNKNSLKTAYTMLLKEKYCDESGQLLPEYPSFYQFRYFYRKHRDMQTYYISRDGLKNYQRNNRPLLGNGVQEFAPNVGVGMLDATVLDIYLVDEAGNLIGRPILTICIDAYSGLCCGYSLSWEGGTYSLRGLMLNVIADKVKHCNRFGILIDKADWNCDKIPATLVTDMGSEYKSVNFEQLAEIGVTKPIGEKRYGANHKEHKEILKCGVKAKNWKQIDTDTLPKVQKAIKQLQGDGIRRPKRVTKNAVELLLGLPSGRFKYLPKCRKEIEKHMTIQAEYWALEIVWAYNKIMREGQVMNWKHIRTLTNMRKKDLLTCMPYLQNIASIDTVQKIESLL